MRTTLWSPTIGDVPANLAFTNNFAATTDPTVNNDSTQNYSAGSVWINGVDGRAFLCYSAAKGAAVWTVDTQAEGLGQQGAPVEHDTSTTMAVADLVGGLIETNPATAVNLELPLATAMDAALPDAVANSSIDFSVINVNPTNAATITTDTGWTLVGSMVVALSTSGHFRARKTAAGAWTLYRV